MKKQFPGFILGFLCAVMLFGLVMSGSARITGNTTIEVEPINIMVNGQVFEPKDANGNPVDVFTYNGSTYAPLRALAEAYGLKVDYDAEKNMATVTDPDTAADPDEGSFIMPTYDWSEEEEAKYQEFKGFWTASEKHLDKYNGYDYIALQTVEPHAKTEQAISVFLSKNPVETVEQFCLRLDSELYEEYKVQEIRYGFILNGTWGWMDLCQNGSWECGYRECLEN